VKVQLYTFVTLEPELRSVCLFTAGRKLPGLDERKKSLDAVVKEKTAFVGNGILVV
jgi:hypothetical protein